MVATALPGHKCTVFFLLFCLLSLKCCVLSLQAVFKQWKNKKSGDVHLVLVSQGQSDSQLI